MLLCSFTTWVSRYEGCGSFPSTSAQAYFLISLSVFYPSSIQGYRSSLPASGLHRHPSKPPYPLCLWCTGPPVARWRGSMLLHSRINWLGVQSKPGNPCWVGPCVLQSAPLVQSIKPQDVPHLSVHLWWLRPQKPPSCMAAGTCDTTCHAARGARCDTWSHPNNSPPFCPQWLGLLLTRARHTRTSSSPMTTWRWRAVATTTGWCWGKRASPRASTTGS